MRKKYPSLREEFLEAVRRVEDHFYRRLVKQHAANCQPCMVQPVSVDPTKFITKEKIRGNK